MDHDKEDSDTVKSTGNSPSDEEGARKIYPQIRLQRLGDAHKKNDTTIQAHQVNQTTTGEEERPRMRRTKMPSARVLERRERQRAMNERIRDTFFDRINGNFFPKEQIEE